MGLLKLTHQGPVATFTIQRPPANALSSEVLRELSGLLDEVEHNNEVRVILIHGDGRFFSAGADIKEFTTIESGAEFAKLAGFGQDLFDRMEKFPKPIIAAIHGAALGGGLELAMGCHFRLVSETAKLGLPELQLGLIPGFAGTQRLPKFVGVARAAEMLFTSDPITGLEAVQYGLANHAYPEEELLEQAYKMANKIAKKGPLALKSTIELLNYAKTEEYYAGVKKEAELFGGVFMSRDGKEGIKAFIEKREPQFKGE
ncbi:MULTISPECIES: enoyl-CoA hydratase [unclassified Bacillus (in: firmicutes)]|uniref:enoyl-CoA hydratase n=1 Tax=unclassified Bacillus (in: firmicutes) TaxID=185979 RepID=UPI0008E7C10F|nr:MULTISPECIES: enoyl-CoA hydratase [unclassified Bacillus (in: firmicutes)]SFB16940.1 enoyl-CoA hydratase [Bacillus sp. UNCCL13]SFQ77747.1 enoyl-CoA hydratase [Bacillus sp. cl95]